MNEPPDQTLRYLSIEHILDSIHDSFVMLDRGFRFVYLNRAALSVFESAIHGKRSLVGEVLWEVFPSLLGTPLEAHYRAAMEATGPVEFEALSPISQRWAAFRASPSPEGLAMFVRDITDQKQALDALRASEERFRLTFDNAPIGLALVALDGRWLRVNQRLCEVVGHPLEEIDHVGFWDLAQPDEREEHRALASAMIRGEISRYERAGRVTRKDGQEVSIALYVSLLRGDKGEPAMFIAKVDDVTARKRLEAQLALSDRLASIGTLASGVAHEINNPLTYVIVNLEYMARELRSAELPERSREMLRVCEEAQEGAERVRRIVRGLKGFSRVDEERRRPVDVRATLDVAISMVGREIRHRARLVKDVRPVPIVDADDSRLTQVFVNLLVNAAQSIPEGRIEANEIGVRTFTDAKGRAVAEVSDTGCGIPARLLDRIFDPFYTTKPAGVGTGLGLSVSHTIVTAFGGALEVESQPGKGSVFRVVLPPRTAAASLAATSSDAAAPTSRQAAPRGRILVVDDEAYVATAMCRVLREEHDVTMARHGRDAVAQIVAGTRFDVILCDLMMPDMSGAAVYREIMRIAPEQASRMVFITGGAFTPMARAFLDEVQNPRMDKPIAAEDLRAVVRAQILARKG